MESGLVGWSPQEKIYHVKRRRRWVRERHLVEKVHKVSNGDVSNMIMMDFKGENKRERSNFLGVWKKVLSSVFEVQYNIVCTTDAQCKFFFN